MTARILVIDDEAAIREAMRMILEYEGYECVLAASGPEGLTAIDREMPDLVFLDVRMPGMDGMEASRRIRAELPRHAQPCIIALTANAMQEDHEACLRAGMDDFLAKPVQLRELGAALERAAARVLAPMTAT